MTTKKRAPMPALTPLDTNAFQTAAIAIPDPVQAVVAPSKRGSPPVSRPKSSARTKGRAPSNGFAPAAAQPSRLGKVQLAVWVTTDKRQALKRRALDVGRAVDDLVNELIDVYLKGSS
jgi:hypothetical protein